MHRVFIFLAPGFEDMEAIATRDVLIRGGIGVFLVSCDEGYLVESSHGLGVMSDMMLEEIYNADVTEDDVLVFPGGMPGTKNLAANAELMDAMQQHWNDGGTVAAICAAPGLVASQLPGIEDLRFTCFEGFQDAMIARGAVYTPESTVTDGRLITGRGAGHAVAFGLAILEHLKGPEAAEKVKQGLML
ncbi:MAG: DJ-1/PfpI family protein [Bacteroidales bacterium]|nr:DJ-1/PfpI family protein [Bacteroidales bacterium]